MLNCEPDNLRQEIEAAINLRKKHVAIMTELVGRYAGSTYREDWDPEELTLENHEFEFVVNTIPAIMANNPSVAIKSRRPVVQRELVEAMQHGLRRWIADVNLKDRLEPCFFDALFKFGTAIVTLEPLPGHEHKDLPPLRPALRRISPRFTFIDPQAQCPWDARFRGHVFIRDRDDLLNAKTADGQPKYNRKAIDELEEGGERHDSISPDFIDDLDLHVDRNQVIAAEVFVREKQMLYTIGFSSTKDGEKRTAAYLRKPRRYFGHPRGPYIDFGFYIVPDQVYPLSPLCVTAEMVEEINAHADQLRRQAARARHLVLVDGTNKGLLDAVKNYEDGTVAGIANFNKNAYAELHLGGPDAGEMDYTERLRGRLDRRSGLSDIQRGQVSGDATATEAQLAAAASSGRTRYLKEQGQRSVQMVLENAAWLMFESQNVVFPVTEEQGEKIVLDFRDGLPTARIEGGKQSEDKAFFGGIQEGQDDFTFFDLELVIEPYSMEEVTEAVRQKRMETAVVTVTKFAPLILQLPYINWPELLDDYFQALNIPDGRKYINFEMLSAMMGMQFAAGAPMGVPGIDGAPPVDLSTFGGPPNMPAGERAEDLGEGGGQPFGESNDVREMAGQMAAGASL